MGISLSTDKKQDEIINKIQTVISSIKNKINENFLPFKIKSVDLNLFYNVHITKSGN